MKKIILAAVASALIARLAAADGHGCKIDVLLALTRPIGSLAPAMALSAEMAM